MSGTVYNRRVPPQEYDKGWFDVELQNLQRAIPPVVIRTITANAAQQIDDTLVLVDCAGGAITFTLLSPTLATGNALTVKKIDATANAVTLAGTVDGVAGRTLPAQYNSLTMVSNGTSWYRTASI